MDGLPVSLLLNSQFDFDDHPSTERNSSKQIPVSECRAPRLQVSDQLSSQWPAQSVLSLLLNSKQLSTDDRNDSRPSEVTPSRSPGSGRSAVGHKGWDAAGKLLESEVHAIGSQLTVAQVQL